MIALVFSIVALLPSPAGEPVTDIASLLEPARRVQQDDLEFWGTLSFRRRVTRERLDADGDVTSSHELDFRITPRDGGFDETLTSIDGRPPTRDEVESHRRAARFTRRYEEALSGETGRSDDQEYGVSGFLHHPGYTYGGVETIAGRPCHRLDFAAQNAPPGAGRDERLWAATEGTLWIENRGLHLVRAETRLARPVALLLGLGKVVGVKIRLDAKPFHDHWIPASIVVDTEIRIIGFTTRKRNVFRYSDYSLPAAR